MNDARLARLRLGSMGLAITCLLSCVTSSAQAQDTRETAIAAERAVDEALAEGKALRALRKSQRARVRADMKSIEMACKLFKLGIGRSPATLEELFAQPANVKRWKGPYIDGSLEEVVDPWGNPYVYELGGGNRRTITSYGADGAPGGVGADADIVREH